AAAALHEIVERGATEAESRGAEVAGSELVGLMPAGAAVAAAGAILRIDGFDASRGVELRPLGRKQTRAGGPGAGVRPARGGLPPGGRWAVAAGRAAGRLTPGGRRRGAAPRELG